MKDCHAKECFSAGQPARQGTSPTCWGNSYSELSHSLQYAVDPPEQTNGVQSNAISSTIGREGPMSLVRSPSGQFTRWLPVLFRLLAVVIATVPAAGKFL